LGENIPDIDKVVKQDFWIDPIRNEPLQWTKKHTLAVLQNVGNRSNLEKISRGFNKNPRDVLQWVEANTTPEDVARAQRLGDVFAELFDEVSMVEERLTGVIPERVELTGVQLHGQIYRGWYHPIRYDKYLPGESQDLLGPNALEEPGFFYPSVPHKFLNTRLKYFAPLDLSLDAVPIRMKQMIHFVAFQEAVVQASKILRDPRFHRSLQKYVGAYDAEQILPWLKDVAGAENFADDAAGATADRALAFFRQNIIHTLIGFNPHTVAKHGMTAWFNSMQQVGAIDYHAALASFVRHPIDNWNFAMGKSEELSRRLRNWSELVQGMPDITLTQSTWRELLQTAGSTPVAISDLMSSIPTWMAAYRKAIRDGKSEGDSVKLADRAVRFGHGSSVTTNQPRIMRSKNQIGKYFSSLYGFFSHILQKQYEIAWKAKEAYKSTKEGEYAEAWKYAQSSLGGIVFNVIIPAVVEEIVTPYTNSERDSWVTKVAKGLTLGISSSYIGVRDFTNAFVNWRDPQMGLTGQIPKAFIDLARDLSAKEPIFGRERGGKTIKDFITLVGFLYGITNAQEGRTAEYLWRYFNNREHPRWWYHRDMEDYIDPLMWGPDRRSWVHGLTKGTSELPR
jgi:hypothetical protein